jgi:hypothetical protein
MKNFSVLQDSGNRAPAPGPALLAAGCNKMQGEQYAVNN